MTTLRQWLNRRDTPEEVAGRKIFLWVTATALCLGFWAQSFWAFGFVVCLVGTGAEVYRTHLDIHLRLARQEREDV